MMFVVHVYVWLRAQGPKLHCGLDGHALFAARQGIMVKISVTLVDLLLLLAHVNQEVVENAR